MKYAAININFDSLGEAYNFPSDYKDPSFHVVADRFLEIADKYNFKYSIYIIGKDLEKLENQIAVKKWASLGHEIGNHSYTHLQNLGVLPKSKIYEEVKKAHDIIYDTTGYYPVGFISPAWNTSSKLLGILHDLGYIYDTSTFPTIIMYGLIFKNLLNYFGDRKMMQILHRNDYIYPFFAPRNVYVHNSEKKDIIVMPLPTNKYRIACWHTLVFIFGWKIHEWIIKSCLKEIEAFYYLCHPADFLDNNDLDRDRKICLERLEYSVEDKLALFEKSIRTILESGRKIVTMRELAEKCQKHGNFRYHSHINKFST